MEGSPQRAERGLSLSRRRYRDQFRTWFPMTRDSHLIVIIQFSHYFIHHLTTYVPYDYMDGEHSYTLIVLALCILITPHSEAERHNVLGHSDLSVFLPGKIYLLELKPKATIATTVGSWQTGMLHCIMPCTWISSVHLNLKRLFVLKTA